VTADAGGGWPAALGAYAARLDAVRDALAAGDPAAPAPFEHPAGLGPLPAGLVPQASALLARARDLARTVEQARDAVAARLAAPDLPGATRPATAPSRLDVAL
jgi:hypothetical protein